MKKYSLKPYKTIMLASAGTLAFAPSVATSKTEAPSPEPQPLRLHQIAVPFDAIIPPFNDEEVTPQGSIFQDELEDFENVGVLFAGERDHEIRLDFLVSNIKNDMPVDVYLAYSTELAPFDKTQLPPGLQSKLNRPEAGPESLEPRPERPIPEGPPQPRRKPVHQPGQAPGSIPQPGIGTPSPEVAAGQICLNLDNFEIIAGVRVEPVQQFIEIPSRLGHPVPNPHSVTISVVLSDLQDFELGQEIYFQAVAFPAGTTDFIQAQASECDRYIIDKFVEGGEGEESSTGSKNDPEEASPEPTGEEPQGEDSPKF